MLQEVVSGVPIMWQEAAIWDVHLSLHQVPAHVDIGISPFLTIESNKTNYVKGIKGIIMTFVPEVVIVFISRLTMSWNVIKCHKSSNQLFITREMSDLDRSKVTLYS